MLAFALWKLTSSGWEFPVCSQITAMPRTHEHVCYICSAEVLPARTKSARTHEFFPWKDDSASGGWKCQRYILKGGSGELCPLNYPHPLLSLIFTKHTSILSISRFTNATIFGTHLLSVSENICIRKNGTEKKEPSHTLSLCRFIR